MARPARVRAEGQANGGAAEADEATEEADADPYDGNEGEEASAAPPPLELACTLRLRRSSSLNSTEEQRLRQSSFSAPSELVRFRDDGSLFHEIEGNVGRWHASGVALMLQWDDGDAPEFAVTPDRGVTFRDSKGLKLKLLDKPPVWFSKAFNFKGSVVLQPAPPRLFDSAIILKEGGLFVRVRDLNDLYASSGVWTMSANSLLLEWHRGIRSEFAMDDLGQNFRNVADGKIFVATSQPSWTADRLVAAARCPSCSSGSLRSRPSEQGSSAECGHCFSEAVDRLWGCDECGMSFCSATCVKEARWRRHRLPELVGVAYRPGVAADEPSWSDVVHFREDGTFLTRFEAERSSSSSSGTWHIRGVALLLRWLASPSECLVPDPSDDVGSTYCNARGFRLRLQSMPAWFASRFKNQNMCALDAIHEANDFVVHSLPESLYLHQNGTFVVLGEMEDFCSCSGTWRATRSALHLTWRIARDGAGNGGLERVERWATKDDGETFQRRGGDEFDGSIAPGKLAARRPPKWFRTKFCDRPALRSKLGTAYSIPSPATTPDTSATSAAAPTSLRFDPGSDDDVTEGHQLRPPVGPWEEDDFGGSCTIECAEPPALAKKVGKARKKKAAKGADAQSVQATLQYLGKPKKTGRSARAGAFGFIPAAAFTTDAPRAAPPAPMAAPVEALLVAADVAAGGAPPASTGKAGAPDDGVRRMASQALEQALLDGSLRRALGLCAAREIGQRRDEAALSEDASGASEAQQLAQRLGRLLAAAASDETLDTALLSLEVERPPWLPASGPAAAEVPAECWGLTLRQWAACIAAGMLCIDRAERRTGDSKATDVSKEGVPSKDDDVAESPMLAHEMGKLVEACVKPWVKGTGSSMALLLNGEAPKKADVMLSFSWKFTAAETMTTILSKALAKSWDLDTVVWCSALSSPHLEGVDLDGLHRAAASRPQHGALVVQASKAAVYDRLWCVYEYVEFERAGLSISPVFSTVYGTEFTADANNRKCIAEACKVDVHRATFGHGAQEAELRARIEASAGGDSEQVNRTLAEFWAGAHEQAAEGVQDLSRELRWLRKRKGGWKQLQRIAMETVVQVGFLFAMHFLRDLCGSLDELLGGDERGRHAAARARDAVASLAEGAELISNAVPGAFPKESTALLETAAKPDEEGEVALRELLEEPRKMPLARRLLEVVGVPGIAASAESEPAARASMMKQGESIGSLSNERILEEPPVRIQLSKKKSTATGSSSGASCGGTYGASITGTTLCKLVEDEANAREADGPGGLSQAVNADGDHRESHPLEVAESQALEPPACNTRKKVVFSARGSSAYQASLNIAERLMRPCKELATPALESQIADLHLRLRQVLNTDVEEEPIYEAIKSQQDRSFLMVRVDKTLETFPGGCCRMSQVHQITVRGFVQLVVAASPSDFAQYEWKVASRQSVTERVEDDMFTQSSATVALRTPAAGGGGTL